LFAIYFGVEHFDINTNITKKAPHSCEAFGSPN